MSRAVWRPLLRGSLAAALLVGCGAGPPELGDAAAVTLESRVAEIRDLATRRQPALVEAKLAELRIVVDDLRGRGELSDQRARQVLDAASAVTRQLALITTTTTQPVEGDKDPDDDKHEEDKDD